MAQIEPANAAAPPTRPISSSRPAVRARRQSRREQRRERDEESERSHDPGFIQRGHGQDGDVVGIVACDGSEMALPERLGAEADDVGLSRRSLKCDRNSLEPKADRVGIESQTG